MSGPPKTPTAISETNGNPGRRPVNKLEPKLVVAAPDMPADLDDDGQREWSRLVKAALKSCVLTEVDRSIVEIAAHAYSTFIMASRAVQAFGITYETTSTTGALMIKPRPEVAIASDAWRRYRAAICELGFTPAARSKVARIDSADGDPADSYLN